MTERAVRITFKNGDDPAEGMHLDIVLNGSTIKRGSEYYGVWFDTSDGSKCPFILNTNGEIDYGAGFEEEDQIYGTNALDIAITEGATITCTFEGEGVSYQIAKITPLAA
ncbi:MAG: hypothetical protein AB7G40_16745 [Hyphomonadaceae bacterium]